MYCIVDIKSVLTRQFFYSRFLLSSEFDIDANTIFFSWRTLMLMQCSIESTVFVQITLSSQFSPCITYLPWLDSLYSLSGTPATLHTFRGCDVLEKGNLGSYRPGSELSAIPATLHTFHGCDALWGFTLEEGTLGSYRPGSGLSAIPATLHTFHGCDVLEEGTLGSYRPGSGLSAIPATWHTFRGCDALWGFTLEEGTFGSYRPGSGLSAIPATWHTFHGCDALWGFTLEEGTLGSYRPGSGLSRQGTRSVGPGLTHHQRWRKQTDKTSTLHRQASVYTGPETVKQRNGTFLLIFGTFYCSVKSSLLVHGNVISDFNLINFYRPQRSCEGYVFTPVCHSVHRGE